MTTYRMIVETPNGEFEIEQAKVLLKYACKPCGFNKYTVPANSVACACGQQTLVAAAILNWGDGGADFNEEVKAKLRLEEALVHG